MVTQKPWFARKTYGWGWTPVTWQGWAVTALYVFGVVKEFVDIDRVTDSESALLLGVAPGFLLMTAALIAACYLTGEKPRWQWGNKKDDV